MNFAEQTKPVALMVSGQHAEQLKSFDGRTETEMRSRIDRSKSQFNGHERAVVEFLFAPEHSVIV